METLRNNAAQTVCARSTVCGEFVQVEFPFAFLSPEEAIDLAQRLTLAAHIVRERRIQPDTRKLPLVECYKLEFAPGASGDEATTAAEVKSSAADNFSTSE